MKYLEKHPIILIIVGVIGISLSSIFVKYSAAPSSVTAAFRLLWTVLLMTPAVFLKKQVRTGLLKVGKKSAFISSLSGVFLAFHFVLMFESLKHTSVASSISIICTEVIWVSFGFCIFLKGKIPLKGMVAIAVTFIGSVFIAFADSNSGAHLYGDILALLAAVAVAVYVLLGSIVRKNVSTYVYTYITYTACSTVLLIICAIGGNNIFGFGMSPVIVGLLLAVFSTIMGHSIFSWCLRYFSPSFVSASKLCEPVVAAIIAIPLFGEVPKFLQIIGGVMILIGVWYYSLIEKR